MTPLQAKALEIAVSRIGVKEVPSGSNRGPEVDQYIRDVGLDPAGHYAWCAAFVYSCYKSAAAELGLVNPFVKTAGVLDHWNRTTGRKILIEQAPGQLLVGCIFFMKFSHGAGHTGIVEATSYSESKGLILTTIEGNTNADGSREGVAVLRKKRSLKAITLGFVEYGEAKPIS